MGSIPAPSTALHCSSASRLGWQRRPRLQIQREATSRLTPGAAAGMAGPSAWPDVFWLVVKQPLWKMMEFVSWGYYSQYMEKKMFQTTNQVLLFFYMFLRSQVHPLQNITPCFEQQSARLIQGVCWKSMKIHDTWDVEITIWLRLRLRKNAGHSGAMAQWQASHGLLRSIRGSHNRVKRKNRRMKPQELGVGRSGRCFLKWIEQHVFPVMGVS